MGNLPIIIVLIFVGVVWMLYRVRKSSGGFSSNIDMVSEYKRRSVDNIDHKASSVKKVVQKAKSLAAKGNIIEAAAVYQSINQQREAISLLEKNGLIKEAASILVKMESYNRAAALYSRNKFFNEAAKAYVQADMHHEGACAARSAGDYSYAAELFEYSGRNVAAAKCYLRLNKFIQAGRCYAKDKDFHKCATCYHQHLKVNGFDSSQIENQDQENIYNWFKLRRFSHSLLKYINGSKYLPKLIIHFHGEDDKQMCVSIMAYSNDDDLVKVIAKMNFQEHKKARLMASYFSSAGKNYYSGMVFDKLGDVNSAAKEYEKSQSKSDSLVRSMALYHKSGDERNASKIKGELKSRKTKISDLNAVNSNQNLQENKQSSSDQNRSDSYENATVLSDAAHKYNPNLSSAGEVKLKSDKVDQSHQPISYSNYRSNPSDKLKTKIPSQVPFTQSDDIGSNINNSGSKDFSSCANITPPRTYYLCGLFVDLNRMECEDIWSYGQIYKVKKNVTVCSGTKPLDSYTVVLDGMLENSQSQEIYNSSASYGELSLLTDYQLMMNVIAKSNSELFVLNKASFEIFCQKHIDIAIKIYKSFIINYMMRNQQYLKSS